MFLVEPKIKPWLGQPFQHKPGMLTPQAALRSPKTCHRAWLGLREDLKCKVNKSGNA